ncbi:MAG: hypothetical protein HYT07_01710 [Candidatus Levybacteria bacterium]|nr:hypothetical protein [Candidatus Levybacteria bacterium]
MFIKIYVLLLLILTVTVGIFFLNKADDFKLKNPVSPERKDLRRITSVDTMKYSRDIAREKLKDLSFDNTIEKQVRDVAATGATHVAVGTPYDDEFLPYLDRWVSTARKYNLSVWFRGNLSGWEKWFDYPTIGRDEHTAGIVKFINNNKSLFEDGDIFVTCNECENGGPGDPRHNGDVAGHREFLIKEYKEAKKAFEKIGKKVAANFNSMNGDVARLIMDKETTKALGGIVVVDHYVRSPEVLAEDLKNIAEKSEGKIVLGEFGVPILDINSDMTEEEQADWINEALARIFLIPEVIGVNYWVNLGGSTSIWNENGSKKSSVDVITSYYTKNKKKLPRNPIF